MARSTYVYSVYKDYHYEGVEPIGHFTVKHEMVSAIERDAALLAGMKNKMRMWDLRIERARDGELGQTEDITDQFVFGGS